ncbi:MAG TPA: substrate-binding domain-containing protein, partial [Candidatus Xenobia bacterium]
MNRLSQLGAAAGLLGLCLFLWALSPAFLTGSNLLNVLLQSSLNGVLAVGMTLVILTGGIDLSVGSVLAASGVVVGLILQAGASPVVAVLGGLAAGIGCGLANGLLITRADLPPFIVTLGMMSAARGLALVWSGDRPISGFDEAFRLIASGPGLIGINIVVYGIAFVLLTRTALGRYVYAVGGNEQAAWLSGVPTRFVKIFVYGVAGALSAVAAVMLDARLNSAQPIAGVNYELDAIAAVVIGGTSLSGGEGSVVGTLIGVLIMSVLRNGLNLLSVSADMQQVIIGVVIVVAVLVDRLRLAPPRWLARLQPARVGLAAAGLMIVLLGTAWSWRLHQGTSGGIRLAVVPKTLNNPFWVDLVEAAQKAGVAHHADIIVQAAELETDSEQQMRLIENLIQKHVSALIVAPAGSKEIVPAIKEANDAGIPVLIIDTRVDEPTLKAAGAHIETFIG